VRQALQTTRRFRQRFDTTLAALSALEIADTVTVRDVVAVLQPAELLERIADEVKVDLVELGEDGRLLRLQLEEVLDGIDPVRRLVVRDYLRCDDDAVVGPGRDGARTAGRGGGRSASRDGHAARHGISNEESDGALALLAGLSTDDLLDVRRVSAVLGLGAAQTDPDAPVEPRGYRLLHRLPRFPEALVDRIIEHFVGLQRIMRTSVAELEEV
jgi:diadenylate cyclase